MRRSVIVSTLCAALAASSAIGVPEDDLVAARRDALELAGAWANDGFRLREIYWSGTVGNGETRVVQVNLYAGNQYWFTAATRGAEKVSVNLFDETGTPVRSENYQEGPRSAAGFAPGTSGPYFVKVEGTEGRPSAFCLIYSYK